MDLDGAILVPTRAYLDDPWPALYEWYQAGGDEGALPDWFDREPAVALNTLRPTG